MKTDITRDFRRKVFPVEILISLWGFQQPNLTSRRVAKTQLDEALMFAVRQESVFQPFLWIRVCWITIKFNTENYFGSSIMSDNVVSKVFLKEHTHPRCTATHGRTSSTDMCPTVLRRRSMRNWNGEPEEPGEQENTFVFEVRVELFVSDFQFLSSNILPERRWLYQQNLEKDWPTTCRNKRNLNLWSDKWRCLNRQLSEKTSLLSVDSVKFSLVLCYSNWYLKEVLNYIILV